MTHALIVLLALLIGAVAGLRSLTAPAVVAWAALIGWIDLHGTWASWMANIITVIVFTVLAVGELVNDKLPKTPARTAAPIFAADRARQAGRGGAGGLAALDLHRARGRCHRRGARHPGRLPRPSAAGRRDRQQDLPIALLEDVVAIAGGFAILAATGHVLTDYLLTAVK